MENEDLIDITKDLYEGLSIDTLIDLLAWPDMFDQAAELDILRTIIERL